MIHGGFWKAAYDLSLGRPLATSLVEHGWAAWNIEYRRVGNGGGAPATFDDVAAAIDALHDEGLPLDRVLGLGHSAGGHLATWAASRGRFPRWPTKVELTGVVSQAGVLDLAAAYDENLGSGAVVGLLGRPPGPDDAPLDPRRQIPLDVPVHCVHGSDDDTVPREPVRRSTSPPRALRARRRGSPRSRATTSSSSSPRRRCGHRPWRSSMDSDGLRIGRAVVVPDRELAERFSRSSGPGGQGVNTADSRVELSYDVARSPSLPETVRARMLARLEGRLVDGVVTVAASEHRTQLANRRAARDRLATLLTEAAAPPPRKRRPTKPSRAAKQRRLDEKKRRSQTKQGRAGRWD